MARQKLIPSRCERTGCDKPVTFFVRHLNLKREAPVTYACADHANWWSYGFYNVRIGTVGKI